MRNLSAGLILSLCLVLCQQTLLAQRAQIDKVVGVVGGEIILRSEVEEQFLYMSEQARQQSMPVSDSLRCAIFDNLLTNALLLHQAKLDSVEVTDAEVNAQIDSRINQILGMMGGDTARFSSYYGKTPFQVRADMQIEMRKQLLTERMKGQVFSMLDITPREVKNYFKRIESTDLPYFPSEVELTQIVLKPKASDAAEERARQKAEMLQKQITVDSADFAELARIHSDDKGSAVNGGDLGRVPRGSFVPEFEAMAFQLEKGEVSPVVKSKFGYHIIQLIERLGNNIHTRHILISPEVNDDDKLAAFERLDSIRQLILDDSISFEIAIQRYSEDEQSKNNAGRVINPETGEQYFEMGDVPIEIFPYVDTATTGYITPPIQTDSYSAQSESYRIIRIESRTEPHEANLKDDYARIRKAALAEKKSRFLNEWLENKIKETHVQLRASFGSCSLLEKWKGSTP